MENAFELLLGRCGSEAPECNDLGIELERRGLAREAIRAYEQACAATGGSSVAAESNRLVALTYTMRPSASAVAREFEAWAARCARPLFDAHGPPPHANAPEPDRRLRVGYVSADFREHPSGAFLEPVLAAHDRRQVEVVCYSDVLKPDAVTARFKAAANVWRETGGMSDVDLARLVFDDRVDVLVETTGHMARNRLLVFARRPAPVQVTWPGYPNNTGMAWAFDAMISDDDRTPPGSEHLYAEPIARLPVSSLCFRPPPDAPDVAPDPPCAWTGHVTFGCLNRLVKVTPEMMRLWARIMAALPGSRLAVLVEWREDPALSEATRARFAAEGVPPGRLDLLPRVGRLDYYRLYNHIDLVPDTFPYNGHTTMLDATWMGVPTVTLVGESNTSRHGLAVLRHTGLAHLIAYTPEEYVEKVIALANRRSELAHHRRILRGVMAASPLCDGNRAAAAAETVYRKLWRVWCGSRD